MKQSRHATRLLGRALIGVVLAFSTLTGPTRADAAEADEATRQEEAGKLYLEGIELYKSELYLAAIKAFKKSLDLYENPKTVYNIAKSYEKLGASDDCVSWYERYVELFRRKNKKEPPDLADINNSVAKCRLGGALNIEVDSDPPGASVYIDDKSKLLGQTPYKTRLEPGTYTLYVDHKDFQAVEKKIVARAGEPQKFTFKLSRPKRTGTLRLKANISGANVFIDGQNIGLTPYNDDITLEEGRHQVTVDKEDYVGVSKTLAVKSNEEYEVTTELWLRDPPSSWKGPVGWVSIGLGAALIGGGFAAGIRADDFFKGTDDFDQWSQLQKIGYIGGGILAGAGLTLVIIEAFDTKAIKDSDAIEETSQAAELRPFWSLDAQGALVGADLRY